MTAPERADRGAERGFAAEALALVAFGLAQPTYQVLEHNAPVLAAHGAGRIEIAAVVVLAQAVPTAVLVLADRLLARAGAAATRAGRALAITGLVAAALLPALHPHLPAPLALLGALAGGALAAGGHRKVQALRTYLRALALAAPVFALAFLLHPGTARYLRAPRGLPPAQARAAPIPVVLVVLDELPLASLLTPSREIDARLFPSFARLAGASTWFRNATSPQAETRFAVPAILSGRDPTDPLAVPILADYPDNLLARLAPSHRLDVHGSLRELCPRGSVAREGLARRLSGLARDTGILLAHALTPPRWRQGLPAIDETWSDFGRQTAADWRAGLAASPADPAAAFDALVAGLDGGGEPAVHAIHAVLPHGPWNRTPTGRSYQAPRVETVAGLALQRHLLQLGFTDRLLGRLIDRLQEVGLWDDALVVVTADHGCSFRTARHRRRLAPPTTPDVARVPLFVKRPRQARGARRDDPVTTLDLAPTIADELGLASAGAGGRPLFASSAQEERERSIRTGPGAEPVPLERGLPEPWPLLDQKVRSFGEAPEWSDVWATRAGSGLVGRALESLAEAPALRARAELEWGRDASWGYLAGRIEVEGDPPPSGVALVAGGVVRAVAHTRARTEHSVGFAALVPPGEAPLTVIGLDAQTPRRRVRLVDPGRPSGR